MTDTLESALAAALCSTAATHLTTPGYCGRHLRRAEQAHAALAPEDREAWEVGRLLGEVVPGVEGLSLTIDYLRGVWVLTYITGQGVGSFARVEGPTLLAALRDLAGKLAQR